MCQKDSHGTEGNHQQPHKDGTRPPRTLVLCFDGTNDSFDEDPTNIIRLFAALEKGKPSKQVVYYQPGIGTYVRPEAPWAPPIQGVAKAIDKGLAWYIGTHITGGYRFLMDHYAEGDKICLFGFSRGAFTARCLAGMLHKVGLLPRSNVEQVNFAYQLYAEKNNWGKARKFKDTFSTRVEVEFVGVWDTVSSVGLGAPLLDFNKSETFVRTFRHALALDERRAKFQPNPWQHKKPCGCHPEKTPGANTVESSDSDHVVCQGNRKSDCWCKDDPHFHGGKKTNVLEVWFRGYHADVGGGNEHDNIRKSLANPSLRWMVTEILKSNCGIIFKEGAFEERLPRLAAKVRAFQKGSSSTEHSGNKHHHHNALGLAPTAADDPAFTPPITPGATLRGGHGAVVQTSTEACSCDYMPYGNGWTKPVWWLLHSLYMYRPTQPEPCELEHTPEEEANGNKHDMLWVKPSWWLLEVVPLWQYWAEEGSDGKLETKSWWRINFGRYRSVDQEEPHFHKSVNLRINDPLRPKVRGAKELKYVHEDDDLPAEVRLQLEAEGWLS